jgi:hypothetical protein
MSVARLVLQDGKGEWLLKFQSVGGVAPLDPVVSGS